MTAQLLSLFIFLAILLVLIGITEALHRFFKLRVEQSRKFLHVSGGLMCLLLPRFFTSHWWILALASLSFGLLLFTYINKWLNSIHQTKRRSIGSVLFPAPVYGCFLLAELMHNNLFFYLPISLLTIADTAAETAGNRWGYSGKQFFGGQKTLAGTIAFFIAALLICSGWLYYYDLSFYEIAMAAILISLFTALTELISLRGWDNLSVPVVANITLWFFIK